jgi:DNA polymerase-1
MTLPTNGKDRFLAIDANAIVHRAFHAYPSTLTTENGVQVNAVYGFTVMLLSALKSFEPKYVLCAFDTHEPTFRHVEYPDYKGTRAPTDQSLIDQFPLVEEILKAFNIPIIKKEGFEADDILGTIAKYVSEKKWSNENLDLYILSGDRDLLQLVNENEIGRAHV